MRAPTDTVPARVREPTRPEGAGEEPVTWTRRIRRHLPALAVIAVAGGMVAAFYLGLYWVKRYNMPIGWDTPRYLDQVNLVAAHGLRGVPAQLPPPIKTLPSRGAFPILTLSLSSLFGVSTFASATVVPPAAAAALALAAGALVTSTLRKGVWSAAAVTLLVGTSAVAIRLMAPETYTDNLVAATIFVAALVPLVVSATGGTGFLAACLLLGAGSIAHSLSFGVVAASILLAALALGPRSWRAWRLGAAPTQTQSVRLAGATAGGAALGAVTIFGILRAAPDSPKLTRGELTKKLREDVPLYRYWFTLPLAALGGVALWRAPRGRDQGTREERSEAAKSVEPAAAQRAGDATGVTAPRLLIILFLAWSAVTVAGLALYAAGRNAPAHRFLSFLIPLPVLGAVAILWLAGLLRRRAGRGVAVGMVAVVIAGSVVLGHHDLYSTLAGPTRGVEWLDPAKVQDAATAAAYLDAAKVPDGAPVVFVVDDQGPNPLSYVPEMTYMLRAVLPADRLPTAYIYVGNPETYLQGRPTYRAHPKTYDVNVNRFWPTIQRLLPQRPVALLLSAYNPMYRAEAARHPERVVAPHVIALAGPRTANPISAPPIPTGPRGGRQGALLGAGALLVLALAGWGWAGALLPRSLRPFETLALAPAFGLAFLIMGGIAADALGVRLVGLPGATVVVAVGVAGAALALLRMRRRRGSDAGDGDALLPATPSGNAPAPAGEP
jgi:hypothetical protein